MKKFIVIILITLTFTLASCERGDDPLECTGDQVLNEAGDACVDPEPIDTYDDRSLVTEECAHLENDGDYQPVWCEEFDYEGLPNSDKWLYDTGGSGFGNNEEQFYTGSDLDNAYVSEGTLKIAALLESMGGQDYTSARLVSKYQGDWLYGKFEIRAKMPSAKGTWSAIWMLPTQYQYGGWPASGEIDIMEHVGYDLDGVHGTIHTAAYNHKLNTQIGFTKTVPTASTEFHVYTLIWEPHYLEFFIDGESYGSISFNALYNIGKENYEAWPFDQEFHMLLNVAVGGSWGGLQGIDDSAFPTTMEVDYVRVYQKDYAGMDQENPSEVTNISLLEASPQTVQFMWDYAEDDVMVKEYQIFIDDELVGVTSLNSYMAKELEPDTNYKIDVVAVDFAGNTSAKETVTLKTDTLASISSRVEAEDYDNQEGVFREATNDVDGDKHVTFLSVDDYMEYELYVPEDGTYKVTYRVASTKEGEIKLFGKSILPLSTTTITNSGSLDTWINVESSTFNLSEGIYTFKIKITGDGFNLNYFDFTKVE